MKVTAIVPQPAKRVEKQVIIVLQAIINTDTHGLTTGFTPIFVFRINVGDTLERI